MKRALRRASHTRLETLRGQRLASGHTARPQQGKGSSHQVSIREGVLGTFPVSELFSALCHLGTCLPCSPVHPHPQTRDQNTVAGTAQCTAHCNHIDVWSLDPVQSWCISLSGPHSPSLCLSPGAAGCPRGNLPPHQPLLHARLKALWGLFIPTPAVLNHLPTEPQFPHL